MTSPRTRRRAPTVFTLEYAKASACERGWTLHDTLVRNRAHRLRWTCEHGHSFLLSLYSLRYQAGQCSVCWRATLAKRMTTHTLQELAAIARKRGGGCNESRYRGFKVRHAFYCAANHTFTLKPENLLAGGWCRRCADLRNGQAKRLDPAALAATAREFRGKYLGPGWVASNQPAWWRCHEGHDFQRTPQEVRSKRRWCPVCGSTRSERLVRVILEQLFRTPLPRARPDWLRNPRTGARLELDGYCPTQQVAFEYQGAQHDRVVAYTRTARELASLQRRDAVKARVCCTRGVLLIRTPTLDHRDPVQHVRAAIRAACNDARRSVPRGVMTSPVDVSAAYLSEGLERCRAWARARGGRCTSRKFPGVMQKVSWECALGHTWMASPNQVLRANGTWCPQCREIARRSPRVVSMAHLQQRAAEHGGACMSERYSSPDAVYEWRCAKGHSWSATGRSVYYNRSWCPTCARSARHRRPIDLEELQRWARSMGGTCEAKQYRGVKVIVRWRCARGHPVVASYDALRQRVRRRAHWCAICQRSEARRRARAA